MTHRHHHPRRHKQRDEFISDYLETQSVLEESTASTYHHHATTTTTDDAEDESVYQEGEVEGAAAEGSVVVTHKKKYKKRQKKKAEDEEEEEETKDEETKDDGILDYRIIFPIDDTHEPSVREMAKLSAYMATMSRHFSLHEMMGYVTTWFSVARALVRVNDQEYRTQVMMFSDLEVRCTCFLFEVIQRLHQAAYAVFRHAIEHMRTALVHSNSPCVLPPMTDPQDTITALDRNELKVLMFIIAEMCRMALQEFHPTWKDMLAATNGIEDDKLREETRFRYSARHTAILGTIATHLLQAHVVVALWNKQPEATIKLAWETASVLAQLKQGIVPDSLQQKFPYGPLLQQLQLLVYKRRIEQCTQAKQWAHSLWLAQRIQRINPGDVANFEALNTALYNCQLTRDQPLAENDVTPIIDLHKQTTDRQNITGEQIQVMDPNALSSVYRERVYDSKNRIVLHLVKDKLVEIKLKVLPAKPS
jgi:hypothetical protein